MQIYEAGAVILFECLNWNGNEFLLKHVNYIFNKITHCLLGETNGGADFNVVLISYVAN